jgi:hypothetical protein
MGNQSQTPQPGTGKSRRGAEQKPKRGQDAADPPRSDDDLGGENVSGEEAEEGTREDAAGKGSRSSR